MQANSEAPKYHHHFLFVFGIGINFHHVRGHQAYQGYDWIHYYYFFYLFFYFFEKKRNHIGIDDEIKSQHYRHQLKEGRILQNLIIST
jgi:hypothetical protein